MDDRRTPLARVRGLGSAKDGVGHWWAQRLTAIALIPLVVWFAISLIMLSGADYTVVRAWIGSPLVMMLLILTIGVGLHHGQLGMQVVIEEDSVVGICTQEFLRLGDVFGDIQQVSFETTRKPTMAPLIVLQKKNTNRVAFHLRVRQTQFV